MHGGAQDFRLAPRLSRIFDRGIVSAATSAKACIFTGGTHSGVMKMVRARPRPRPSPVGVRVVRVVVVVVVLTTPAP